RVAGGGKGRGPEALRLGHRLVGLALAGEIVDGHARALASEGQRDGSPETAARPRDEGAAAFQLSRHQRAALFWLFSSQNLARSMGFGHHTSFLPRMRWINRSTIRIREGRPITWGCPSQL